MPRTRVRNQKTVKPKPDEENMTFIRQRFAEIRKDAFDTIEDARSAVLEAVDAKAIRDRLLFVKKYNNLTLSELANMKSLSSLSSTYFSGEDISNITSTAKTKNKIQRSSSFAGDDEGYLTTESTNSGPRASRSRAKKARTTAVKSRMSRSLSRSINPPVINNQLTSNDMTPLNKATPPNTYGLITPKVKPNTPLVLLRRPKMGEVAVSMQGSPILTLPVMTEKEANINIPLVDGTLLSLQPQRGLRKSQIPDLDPEVKRQLAMLRENLNMML